MITIRLLGWLALLVLATPTPAETLHWYRGNTHTHTINSDGDASPDVVARWYREQGYQFLFITDHEYLTDVAPLNALLGATERFLVLPGQEVTQWIEGPKLRSAHFNALFAREVVWPIGVRKCAGKGCGAYAPESTSLAEIVRVNIAAIRAGGAIAQVNHPNRLWTLRPEDLRDVPDGTLTEVWNGAPNSNSLGGDDGAGDMRPAAEGFWDALLSQGKKIWGVGSDDSHRDGERGIAWIMVRAAALTPAAIRDSIERGDFYASGGVVLDDISSNDESLSVTIGNATLQRNAALYRVPGNEPRFRTRFIGQGGAVLAEVGGMQPVYRFRGGETYVRASIIDSNGKRAWTQPVFRDRRKTRR